MSQPQIKIPKGGTYQEISNISLIICPFIIKLGTRPQDVVRTKSTKASCGWPIGDGTNLTNVTCTWKNSGHDYCYWLLCFCFFVFLQLDINISFIFKASFLFVFKYCNPYCIVEFVVWSYLEILVSLHPYCFLISKSVHWKTKEDLTRQNLW